jgi:uncharacterized protein YuzB (UPF0349 family)
MNMGIGIVVVEVCDRNGLVLQSLEDLETKYPEVAVIQTNCMNMCNLCRARPYALVNGKQVFAKDPNECIQMIEEIIKDELKHFYSY